MVDYTNQPTVSVDFIQPETASFDEKGNAIEGPRNGLGQPISIGFSGGGIVTATYANCFASSQEQHEYRNWLGSRCNGGFRFVNVPVYTDWSGPFPYENFKPVPRKSFIPHSDGALFSDGSGYEQPTVWGQITEAAALNAGVLSIQLFGAARPLRWSDWFSIYHPTKGWRAYRVWEIRDADSSDPDAPIYTVAITPPLREAVAVDDRAEFDRPRCVMKFAADFTLPFELDQNRFSKTTIKFVEAW